MCRTVEGIVDQCSTRETTGNHTRKVWMERDIKVLFCTGEYRKSNGDGVRVHPVNSD